ncbi:MAG: hypothetical protein ACM3JJ_06665 [Hyphomicrobiales bacterium]
MESNRPRHLRIPFKLQIAYGSRKMFTVFSGVMAAVSLYGPLPARLADHNGYRYMVGPFLCPLIALGMHLAFPFNPYRWNGPAERSLNRLDERDEGARRLVEILQSPEYRTTAFLAAARLAGILWIVLAACAFVFRSSLDWHPVTSNFFYAAVGGVLFSWMFVRMRVMSWALSTWWARYGGSGAGDGNDEDAQARGDEDGDDDGDGGGGS